MNTNQHYLKMFHYDDWATRECLSALRSIVPPPEKVLRLLAHTLSAQKLWFERMQGVHQSVAVWPASTIDQCFALADEMLASWTKFLSGLCPAGFEQAIEYHNSKGEPWSSRVEDILTHVLMHSAYHRGQVALEMRAAGLQPAYTDFVHAVRQGHVK
ncbi:MAG: DinB family protein [Acidobacteria bacterium]|nr:DinB family protein [Acidobacteriota bacterium]